jgi:proteasome assembly chaperone (PAC2) family protein
VDNLVELWEVPKSAEIYMIAGWDQWADAGNISSGLPQYLIEATEARRIGELSPEGFYLFQVPGTHHFLRPEIKLERGYRRELARPENTFYYTGDTQKGLVIFLGAEPHLNVDRYAEAFLDAVEELGIKRVVALGGVYGAAPFDRDRSVHCVVSLWGMQESLERFAVTFSDYEGGTTIGTLLADRAERRGIELVDLYAFVPAYDFSGADTLVQGMRIDNDYRAWHETMRRLNVMFGMEIDLSDLERRSAELTASMHAKVRELELQAPELQVRQYLQRLNDDFDELPFTPLDDVWEAELGDLLGDI